MRRKAVLIIHGFAGGIYDQEDLANELELIDQYDVFSFTLPGHDQYVLTGITKDDWIKSVDKHINKLIDNGYKEIYLVGHSMGGVISTIMANKYKEIKKIILAAPAFQYLFSTKTKEGFKISVKLGIQCLKRFASFKELLTRRLSVPNKTIREFRQLVRENQNEIDKIKVPVMIIHGTIDDIVPFESSIEVFKRIPHNNKKFLIVEGLSHRVFKDIKQNEIIEESIKFLNEDIKEIEKIRI